MRIVLRVVIMFLCLAHHLAAKPRPALPPFPEGELAAWRFNNPANPAEGHPLLAALNLRALESWSGYALEMTGTAPTLFAVPELAPDKKPNFTRAAGTLRCWFAPAWTSGGEGGSGPGVEARLLEVGSWSERDAQAWWSLRFSADGNGLRLVAEADGAVTEVLRAPTAWCAG